MEMTPGEILTSYRQAKKKNEQISILAQLNATTREQIIEILKDQGVDGRALPRLRQQEPLEAEPTTMQEVEPAKAKEAPPRGLKPRWLHEQERMAEIVAAVNRYTQAGRILPIEWLEEYNDLAERKEKRDKC